MAASSRVLELDPQNTKALYRRAQARSLPASAGTVQQTQALEDLRQACQLRPDDAVLTSAFAELKVSLIQQRKKDKQTFGNLFQRSDKGVYEEKTTGSDRVKRSEGNSGSNNSQEVPGKQRTSGDGLRFGDAMRMLQELEIIGSAIAA